MKNIVLFSLLFISLDSFSQKAISFPVAKFQTGDQPQWKEVNFDDSKWPSIKTAVKWEPQGYQRYNGYAWYRIKFILPSSLKKNAFWKDSLSFWLGKIDDVDETFLNGKKIGQTGSLPTDAGGYAGRWDAERIYVLPVNAGNIYWDKENVIAIRVFDNTDGGGMFGGVPFVKMMVPIDEVEVRLKVDSLTSNSYQATIVNASAKVVEGQWAITVKDGANDKVIQSIIKPVKIQGFEKIYEKVKVEGNRRLEIVSSFKEKSIGAVKDISKITPYLLTPPPADKPRINSTQVFGIRPNSPFLFKVAATGKKPLRYKAANLPEGLRLDENTGIITGKISAEGIYNVRITVANQLGNAIQNFIIKAGNQLALTPVMGWNSWNCWGLSVSDEKVKSSAQALIDKGLIDHGWNYINIDDGWQSAERNGQGELLPNEKFGDITSLGSWLHGNGLKLGIYSSPGNKTCGGYLGSYQHERQDAATYSEWGIDFLKYDWCSYDEIFYKAKDSSLHAFQQPYKVMQAALQEQPRDIVYSLCQYGMGDVWKWGPQVNGNSWRTTGDIRDTWESVRSIGFNHPELYPYANPGHWNDPDMLVVGQVGWSGLLWPTRLTPDEQYAHISLWCLLSAPLLIGCDVSQLDAFTLNLLTNDEVLAVDQDVLGMQAQQKLKTDKVEIWVKQLADGSKAVGIFNMSGSYQNIHLKWSDAGLQGSYKVRDLWRQKEAGVFKDNYVSQVPPHGVTLIKLMKK